MRRLAPLLLSCLAASALASRSLPDIRGDHDLPGWGGERKVPRRVAKVDEDKVGTGSDEDMPAVPVFLSWSPRIILVERFLSKDEAAHVIDLARCVPRWSSAKTRQRQCGPL